MDKICCRREIASSYDERASKHASIVDVSPCLGVFGAGISALGGVALSVVQAPFHACTTVLRAQRAQTHLEAARSIIMVAAQLKQTRGTKIDSLPGHHAAVLHAACKAPVVRNLHPRTSQRQSRTALGLALAR